MADTSAYATGPNSFQVNGVTYYLPAAPSGQPAYTQQTGAEAQKSILQGLASPQSNGWVSTSAIAPVDYSTAPTANSAALLKALAQPNVIGGLDTINLANLGKQAYKTGAITSSGYTNYALPGHQLSGGFIKGDYAPSNSNAILKALSSISGVLDKNGNPVDWSKPINTNEVSSFYVPTKQFGLIPKNEWAQGPQDTRNTVESGGSFLHNVGGFINDTHLAQIAGLAAMVIPGLQPLSAGLNIASGIANKNIGQVIGGATGIPGVNNAVNSFVGSGLSNLGIPASVLPYATKGAVNAGTTLLSGGSPAQALTNGAASGIGMYGGQQVANLFGQSGLPASVTQGLSQASAGALGSAIRGGDIGRGALISGVEGAAQGATKDFRLGNFGSSAVNGGANLFGQFLRQSQQKNAQQAPQQTATSSPQLGQLQQRVAAFKNQQAGVGSGTNQPTDPAKLAQLKQRIAGLQAAGG